MSDAFNRNCTVFDGHRRLLSGPLSEAALTVKRANEDGRTGPVLIYDDATGRVIDVDLRGSDDEIVARLALVTSAVMTPLESGSLTDSPRSRGRPKLGVVPREVTLLPRHWEWLNAQPGGASVALRKLVEAARHDPSGKDHERQRQERAYRFMVAIAGDLPGYEEATRALFAGDRQRFDAAVAEWPVDVRHHATQLGFAQ